MFRVITAAEYIEYFASDRRHMLKPDGTWMAEPPEYPPIATKGIVQPIFYDHHCLSKERPYLAITLFQKKQISVKMRAFWCILPKCAHFTQNARI